MQNLTKSAVLAALLVLSGCANLQKTDHSTLNKIKDELKPATQTKANPPAKIDQSLLPPLKIALPKVSAKKLEPRFDLVINNAPAVQVLMGIVSDTKYSMLVHPTLSGTVTLNLKDVTVFDVLDSMRDLYGYEYKVEGNRIFVEPQTMQTRIFQVNYIVGKRAGSSDTQVKSSSVTSSGQRGQVQQQNNNGTAGNNNVNNTISSSVSTKTDTDFWSDLNDSLKGLIGSDNGKQVVVNNQSGVIMVRAMPAEIRNVETFLKLMQLTIERQVILEAKILNVQLNEQSQQGVNWSVFGSSGSTRGTVINGTSQAASNVADGLLEPLFNNAATTALGGPLFAVALQGANFSALLSFLQSQGDVQVLSSPRIATINNQKAVLKVGTDEFFVTGISSNTTASTGATTTTPEVTLQPFFSGIALDVTPQIDRDDNIILHVHPSISQVSTVNKQVNIGGVGGVLNLPLASSNISETDSIVRTRDGRVIAIGGLMTENNVRNNSKVPGIGDIRGVGEAFKQKGGSSSKSELVILLKATVVHGQESWDSDMLASQKRIERMQRTEDSEAN